MTAIAAAISNRGIACGSDSMLTATFNDEFHIVEWEKSKIIKVERCKACISYWGLAGQLKALPKTYKLPIWDWTMHDWLSKKVAQNTYTNLQDFSNWLRDELETKLRMTSLKADDKGIGIHILGHEFINGYNIPELFLLSNFGYNNGSYKTGTELQVGRHSYHTISGDGNLSEHGNHEYRLQVREHLNKGNMIFYNNGDPQFFNSIAIPIYRTLMLAQRRGIAKELNSVSDLAPFVKQPISMISSLQRAFHREGKRLIGGKIHCLVIEPDGRMMEI